MIRGLNVVLTITSLLALIGVYGLKYSVEETAGVRAGLQHTIERQQSDLSLLKADWAYLTQPAHVGPIITRHKDALMLQITGQKQFGSLAALPMRPAPAAPDTAALDKLFQSLDAGVDPADTMLEGQ
jgi:hypothetical protein